MAAPQPVAVGVTPSQARTLRGTAAARWKALAPRERQALSIGGAAASLIVVWMLGLQPALRMVREAPPQIAALEAELQSMRSLATEAGSLRGAAPVSRSQAVAALEAATRQLGTTGRLAIQGDRATLTLDATNPAGLAQWLALARSAARARPVEMQLMQGPAGLSGSLVVLVGVNP